MGLTNFGVIPGGTVGAELLTTTRRAIMPAVVVQIGKSTVTLSSMLAAAEPVSGGVSPMTLPVQGVRMVSGGWANYSGGFSAPQVIPGMYNAEYNLKAFVVGIPYYMFEGLVQNGAEIVPLLWARMNDAGNYISDQLATALWAALSANTALMPFSLNDIIATTDPTQGNVGNLASSNTWWVANVTTIGTINTASTAVSRVNALAALNFAQKGAGGEPPSCGICSPGFWAALAADCIAGENYIVSQQGQYGNAADGASIGFPAINVGGIPIYADLYYPNDTTITFPNWNYTQYKVHEDATFAVAGPESLLPQFQLGYVMACFVLLENVCSKRSANSRVTTWTGAFVI